MNMLSAADFLALLAGLARTSAAQLWPRSAGARRWASCRPRVVFAADGADGFALAASRRKRASAARRQPMRWMLRDERFPRDRHRPAAAPNERLREPLRLRASRRTSFSRSSFRSGAKWRRWSCPRTSPARGRGRAAAVSPEARRFAAASARHASLPLWRAAGLSARPSRRSVSPFATGEAPARAQSRAREAAVARLERAGFSSTARLRDARARAARVLCLRLSRRLPTRLGSFVSPPLVRQSSDTLEPVAPEIEIVQLGRRLVRAEILRRDARRGSTFRSRKCSGSSVPARARLQLKNGKRRSSIRMRWKISSSSCATPIRAKRQPGVYRLDRNRRPVT